MQKETENLEKIKRIQQDTNLPGAWRRNVFLSSFDLLESEDSRGWTGSKEGDETFDSALVCSYGMNAIFV